jgi:L-amino acid N-acyltransferase YncA
MNKSNGFVGVRQATISDAEAIARIWIAGVPDAFGAVAPSDVNALGFFTQKLASQDIAFQYWIAYQRNAVMGWCSLQPCRNNPLTRRKMGELSVYVCPEHSNNGVARMLIERLIEHASSVGITYIVGYARLGNYRILHLLHSMGWVSVGTLPMRMDSPDEPLVYLGRVITSERRK